MECKCLQKNVYDACSLFGRFRWVFCQLEVLQHCLPQSIRRTLHELPTSLDETYERVLKEIGTANLPHAYRLLQCLTVAIRPLHIEELAGILALDFQEAEGATPTLIDDWRWEDRQRAVLSTCSSLITVVDDGGSRVIQFSRFTVKEFLTSHRLATSKGVVSHFHIIAEPAHATLAQACLGTLLQLDDISNHNLLKSFPLASYASQYWVDHAQFGKVSSQIEDGMRSLFDSRKPYFAAWLRLHDIDEPWAHFKSFGIIYRGSPLYYASLCGFRNVAAHLIVEYPEQVNSRGGWTHSPLAAALYKGHFHVADLLHQHGAAVDVSSFDNQTLLHAASLDGLVDVAQWLLDHGANPDSQIGNHSTPINFAAMVGCLSVVRMLLNHSAHVNNADFVGQTPLHQAIIFGHVEIARLLLQRGADVEAQDRENSTPLHLASSKGRADIVRLLLDHGTIVDAEDKDGNTPLHLASSWDRTDVMCLLIDRGANTEAENKDGNTPLHIASQRIETASVRLLLDRGANTNSKNKSGSTPLHLAWWTEIARLLLDGGANANTKDNIGWTPLHIASSQGLTEIVRLLLDRGTNANIKNNEENTPLHFAWRADIVRILLDHGADADAENEEGNTPLHVSSCKGRTKVVRLLLGHSANVHAKNKAGRTPIQAASGEEKGEIIQMLTKHGAQIR